MLISDWSSDVCSSVLAVVDLRQILDLLVDPTARLRHAIDLVDDRLAVLILQLDPQIAHALTNVLGRVAADVALPLQHIKDADPQIRRRALDDCLARTLSVADSRQQIAQGITQQHLPDTPLPARLDHRSEERRVGNESGSRCRSWWYADH